MSLFGSDMPLPTRLLRRKRGAPATRKRRRLPSFVPDSLFPFRVKKRRRGVKSWRKKRLVDAAALFPQFPACLLVRKRRHGVGIWHQRRRDDATVLFQEFPACLLVRPKRAEKTLPVWRRGRPIPPTFLAPPSAPTTPPIVPTVVPGVGGGGGGPSFYDPGKRLKFWDEAVEELISEEEILLLVYLFDDI